MIMLKDILFIGLGGGIGSICRFVVSLVIGKWIDASFPWGTFTINLLGSLLIGFFLGFFDKSMLNEPLKLLLITGFCGGFTTFSAFSAENLSLLMAGQWLTALAYSLLSVLIGIAAVWLGFKLSASF
jgi:CrcB protein